MRPRQILRSLWKQKQLQREYPLLKGRQHSPEITEVGNKKGTYCVDRKRDHALRDIGRVCWGSSTQAGADQADNFLFLYFYVFGNSLQEKRTRCDIKNWCHFISVLWSTNSQQLNYFNEHGAGVKFCPSCDKPTFSRKRACLTMLLQHVPTSCPREMSPFHLPATCPSVFRR